MPSQRFLNFGLGHAARPQTVRISFSFASQHVIDLRNAGIGRLLNLAGKPIVIVFADLVILFQFLDTSMASRRTWRTATRAVSAYLCATFTNSLRRSSLSSGMRRRIVWPSVAGDKPEIGIHNRLFDRMNQRAIPDIDARSAAALAR